MATPQAELTARMAEQFGLQIVQFRYSDELLFGDGEVMKLFMPRSKRVLLGTPQDRMIIGDLKFVRKRDLTKLRSPSIKFEQPLAGFGCPLANFPWLVPFCWISEDRLDERLVVGLRELFNELPDTESGWRSRFGPAFFEMTPIDRLAPIVRYLRKFDPELGPD